MRNSIHTNHPAKTLQTKHADDKELRERMLNDDIHISHKPYHPYQPNPSVHLVMNRTQPQFDYFAQPMLNVIDRDRIIAGTITGEQVNTYNANPNDPTNINATSTPMPSITLPQPVHEPEHIRRAKEFFDLHGNRRFHQKPDNFLAFDHSLTENSEYSGEQKTRRDSNILEKMADGEKDDFINVVSQGNMRKYITRATSKTCNPENIIAGTELNANFISSRNAVETEQLHNLMDSTAVRGKRVTLHSALETEYLTIRNNLGHEVRIGLMEIINVMCDRGIFIDKNASLLGYMGIIEDKLNLNDLNFGVIARRTLDAKKIIDCREKVENNRKFVRTSTSKTRIEQIENGGCNVVKSAMTRLQKVVRIDQELGVHVYPVFPDVSRHA